MTAAADYSFNKSHAACYALIAYRTAYLKANYPAEYMAAVISSVMSTKDKVPFFVNRCEEMGIEVAAPRRQHLRPRLRRQRQQDPLRARRGQERRPLRGRGDHRRARGAAVRLALGLLRAGRRARRQQARDRVPDQVRGLDSTGRRAGRCSTVLPARAVGRARSRRRTRQRGQASIFALEEAPAAGGSRSQHPPLLGEEFEQRELLAMEKETLGTFLSDHPLSEVRDALRVRADCTLTDLDEQARRGLGHRRRDRRRGKKIRTKSGSNMMFATLDDLEGRVEMIVFAKSLEAMRRPDRHRRRPPRPRTGRPQGPRRDQARRPGRRGVRAHQRRGRDREGQGRGAGPPSSAFRFSSTPADYDPGSSPS